VNNEVKLFLFLMVLSITQGCSVAPFTVPSGGTTLGKDNKVVRLNVLPTTAASIGYGASANVDLGATFESQIGAPIAVWGKHSLLNQKAGLSVAYIAGAFGGGDNRKGFYIAPTFGYSSEKVEWYSIVRYNDVYWEGDEDAVDGESIRYLDVFPLDRKEFSYWQIDFGGRSKVAEGRTSVELGVTCVYYKDEYGCLPIAGLGFGI